MLLSQTLVLRSRQKLHVKARNLMSVASCECVVGCNKLTTVTTVLSFSRLSSASSRCYYIGRLSDFLQLRVQHAQHNHDQFRFRHRYHQEEAAPNEYFLWSSNFCRYFVVRRPSPPSAQYPPPAIPIAASPLPKGDSLCNPPQWLHRLVRGRRRFRLVSPST